MYFVLYYLLIINKILTFSYLSDDEEKKLTCKNKNLIFFSFVFFLIQFFFSLLYFPCSKHRVNPSLAMHFTVVLSLL